MSKQFLFILGAALVFVAPFYGHAEDAKNSESFHLETPPDIDGWGVDIGFGSQPYMERATKIGFLSPHLFEGMQEPHWRMSFEFVFKTLQAFNTNSIYEIALSLESNNKVYKDLVYSYTKFGIGTMTLENVLYDGSVLTVPLSLGVQIVTTNTRKGVMSYFIEYRFVLYKDYDEKKSLPAQANVGIDEAALFSSTISTGIRFIF